MITGNLIAQLIGIISIPILTRIFSPSHFGTFALFMAFTNIFSKVGTLCYERAVLLPKEKEDAIGVFVLAFYILFIVSALMCFGCFFFGLKISIMMKNVNLHQWILLLPAAIFLNGAINILGAWNIRISKFKSVAFSKICHKLVAQTSKLSLGSILKPFSGALIIGELLGSLVKAFILSYKSDIKILNEIFLANKNKILILAKKYKKFAFFSAPNVLLNIGSENIVIFIFTFLFSPAVVGFYSIANRMIKQPLILISNSVQSSYLQMTANDIANSINILPKLIKITSSLALIALIPTTIIAVFGKQIFTIVFGQKWVVSGTYVQVMAPWLFFLFIRSPSNVVFEVCQKQNIRFIINIFTAIARIFSLLFGYYLSNNPVVVIGAFVIVNCILEIVVIAYSIKIAKINDRSLSKIH